MTGSDRDRELTGCSVRDLQLYAAGCLEAYCKGKGLRHPSIDDLLKHLNGYPETDDLPAWDRAGASLVLNGRGDELPHDLIALMSPQEIEAFSSIVDSAVEVGIVDLYGGSTELPVIFARKITSMLRRNAIDVPDLKGTISA